LKLHEELRKAESLLAIELRRGTNGLDIFSSMPESPLSLHPFAVVAEDNKQQNISSSSPLGMLGHDTS
jgi:hypothetical protein